MRTIAEIRSCAATAAICCSRYCCQLLTSLQPQPVAASTAATNCYRLLQALLLPATTVLQPLLLPLWLPLLLPAAAASASTAAASCCRRGVQCCCWCWATCLTKVPNVLKEPLPQELLLDGSAAAAGIVATAVAVLAALAMQDSNNRQ